MDVSPNFFEEDYEKCRMDVCHRDEPVLIGELKKAVMDIFKGEKI